MHTINYVNLFLAITVGWWSRQLVASSIICVWRCYENQCHLVWQTTEQRAVCDVGRKTTELQPLDISGESGLYVNFRSLVMPSFRDINFP